MVKKKAEEQEIVVENVNQVAYFSMRGCKVKPFKRDNGRVAFIVNGDIADAMSDLAKNTLVPILDYIQMLQAIRSMVFTMKGHK